MTKIVLGSAQFGMDYGINNKRGRIPEAEVFKILKKATGYGVNTIDTAYFYGDSEKIIGDFIKSRQQQLNVISKLPKCPSAEIKSLLNITLSRLNAPSLYGYLIHNFDIYEQEPAVWAQLEAMKSSGKVKKIGFSLYFPENLEKIFKRNLKVDLIQIPYSIFDQRFQPYFSELKKRKIEIYARSVFLQGLVFRDPKELSSRFAGIKEKIRQIHLLSRKNGVTLLALCLNFVLADKFINKVVIGVDSFEQFVEVMEASELPMASNLFSDKLFELRETDENIILPCNWYSNKVQV